MSEEVISTEKQANFPGKKIPFRYTPEEFSGALGDFGTIIPIVFAVAIVADVELSYMLLFFSVWFIATGLYFRLPFPVEPMKVVGALVIAGGLSRQEIAASGIVLGLFFLLLGYFKGFVKIKKLLPQSVVRGIQLGLGLVLLKTSYGFFKVEMAYAFAGVGIILAFVLLKQFWKLPDLSTLVILLLGISIGFMKYGFPEVSIIAAPQFILPGLDDFARGTWLLALPQIPLTISNAILATSLLYKDIFRERVEPDKLSVSTGIMNLASSPFGGFPMCHGAGGLAAQYRFGARTGGSNLITGLIILPVAVFFASPAFLAIIPYGFFGALLVFVAIELGRHGLKTDSYPVTIVVAIASLLLNFTVALFLGLALHFIISRWFHRAGFS